MDPLSDAEIESNETVSLTLAAGVDYTVATTTAVVATIVNDDFPIISLAVSPETVAEDGAVNLVYIFSRTGATTSELTVAVAEPAAKLTVLVVGVVAMPL